MTVYQQIQNAIDLVEQNLHRQISSDEAAAAAHMSLRCFYNYFEALTGQTYGAYARRRRLSQAFCRLREGHERVVDIALASGYESHEAFSRAFRTEFGVTPVQLRRGRRAGAPTGRVTVTEEGSMEVIVRDLGSMRVVSCTAFSPEPETKAHDRIWEWATQNGQEGRPHRNFGHDTDPNGRGYSNLGNRRNYGYKVMLTIGESVSGADVGGDLKLETLEAGRFLVTGVEGDVASGSDFIGIGWRALLSEAVKRGYRVKPGGRCLEEKLEPSRPGLLRLDLYTEIE